MVARPEVAVLLGLTALATLLLLTLLGLNRWHRRRDRRLAGLSLEDLTHAETRQELIVCLEALTGIDAVETRARVWLEELLQLPRQPVLETRRIARTDAIDCLSDDRIDLPRFVAAWTHPDHWAAVRRILAKS